MPERCRPAQLDATQLASVRAAVLLRPTEHGFGTELWTFTRVGAVIERQHGVGFSQTQVWRILDRLGFSPQKPENARSSETKTRCGIGSAARGLRFKKAQREGQRIVFIEDVGYDLDCLRRMNAGKSRTKDLSSFPFRS